MAEAERQTNSRQCEEPYCSIVTPQVSVKQLDDITKCPICNEVYTDPRVLRCMHTYCLKCIETSCKDKNPEEKVACLLCRLEFNLPNNEPQDLKKDHFVEFLLQIKQLSSVKSASVPCDVCNQEVDESEAKELATMYCPKCREKLCEKCGAVHRNQKMTMKHQLALLGEPPKSEVYATLEFDYCEKHPANTLEIYCSECKRLVCSTCCIGAHKRHETLEVVDISDQFMSEMSSDCEQMTTGIKTCEETLEKLTKVKDDFVADMGKSENEIGNRALQLKGMIERHKQQRLEELRKIKARSLEEIERRSEAVEKQLQAMKRVRQYASELMDKGTPCHLATMASSLHDRTQELLEFNVTDNSDADLGYTDVKFVPSNGITDDPDRTIGEIVQSCSRVDKS